MNITGFELPLMLLVTVNAMLAVTTARRTAWVGLGLMIIFAALLEFHPTGSISYGLIARLAALGLALLIAMPDGIFTTAGFRSDLAPRQIVAALVAHPVVAASAVAGLLLGSIPLALPIETSNAAVRAAGIALLMIGVPPLLTSRYVEATSRAALVAISGTLLLRASIFGALEPIAALAFSAGLATVLIVGARVASTIAAGDES